MTQEVSSTLVESEPCMWGSATLVMLVSSIWVTVISITEMVIDHFFADDSEVAGCSGSVTLGRTTGRRTPARACPAVARVVVGEAAVHGRAVVPDDEVAHAPRVAVDELALGSVLDEIAQQQPPLGYPPVHDARGVRGHVERAAARARDRADERMHGAL